MSTKERVIWLINNYVGQALAILFVGVPMAWLWWLMLNAPISTLFHR
jgi:hypothetical protein